VYVSTDDHAVGLGLARDSSYEPHVARLLTHLLQPGCVFIDIGANIGYFSLVAARLVGPSGRVLAFEPNKRNGALLWLSCVDNNFQQLELFPVAASDSAGAIVLQVAGSNGRIVSTDELALAGIAPAPNGPPLPPHHYHAATVVLDDILHTITRIDVVKLDVEGAEPWAIAGMQQLIHRHRPLVISEFAPLGIEQTTQRHPENYLLQLRQLGYTLFVITDTTLQPLPHDYATIQEQWFGAGRDHIDILGTPTSGDYTDLISQFQ
jgi:FkbM family methyltransferase